MHCLQPEDTALTQETISPEMLEFAITASKQLAKRTQHRPEFVDLDHEDIAQELLLYVVERAEQFDPKKANHEAFVNRMLKTGLGTMIRNANRKKARPPIGVAIQSITTSVEQPRGRQRCCFDSYSRRIRIDAREVPAGLPSKNMTWRRPSTFKSKLSRLAIAELLAN